MNNNTSSLLSQFTAGQLQLLRSPRLTLEEKDKLITKLKQENAQVQEKLT